jgi:hypothetical protein
MMKNIAIALLLFFVSVSANAKSLYVSTSGSDAVTYSANDVDHPWLTVGKGFTSALPGDIVYFRGGSYSVSSSVQTSGNTNPTSESGRVIFTNYPGETPVITSTVSGASDEQNGTIMIDRDYYTVSGLTISGPSTLVYIGNNYSAINSIIENNTLTLTIYGGSPNLGCIRTQATRANGAIIRKNTLIGPGTGDYINTAGVFIFRTQGVKVVNNDIHGIPRGIFYKHTCIASDTGIEMSYNYIHDVNQGIVSVSQYAKIQHNIITCNSNSATKGALHFGEDGGTGDDGSNIGGAYNLITHNTCVINSGSSNYVAGVNIDHGGTNAGINNTVKDNLFLTESLIYAWQSGTHGTTINHNVYPSAAAMIEYSTHYSFSGWTGHYTSDTGSVAGVPSFLGGTVPSTIAGFALNSGSAGYLVASDGTNMGADATLVGTGATAATPPSASIPGGNQTASTSPIILSYTTTAGTNAITSRTWTNSAGGSGSVTGDSGTFSVPLTIGSNLITLTASDGTLSGSASVTITYNLSASTVTVTPSTSNNQTVSSSSFSVSGTATTTSGTISSVTCPSQTVSLNSGTGAWSFTATLSSGVNNFVITATDSNGSTGTATITVTYVPPGTSGLTRFSGGTMAGVVLK